MNRIGSLIIGPNASGKSLMAERAIEVACARPLYLGTLPLTPPHLARIATHRERRDGRWTLIEELTPQPESIGHLEQRLEKADGFLLDGLSSLLWSQVARTGMARADLAAFSASLTALLCAGTFQASQVVDCAVPFPQHGKDYWFNVLIAEVHLEMAGKCQSVVRLDSLESLQNERKDHAQC